MKIFRNICLGLAAFVVGAACLFHFWAAPLYAVPILMYHSFDTPAGKGNLLSVSPEHFEQQMAFLKNNGYHVITLNELTDGLKAGRKFPHNTVVITIDDGYQNNYTYAYPVLKKYGFPATIFIATNLMDLNDAFLTWNEVLEMAHHGVDFGGHTKNHVYLPSITDKAVLWDEIAGSKAMIEKQAGVPAEYFCYPTGGFTPEIKAMVQKAGYKGACTTNRGYDLLNRTDFYEMDRVSVRNTDLGLKFANKLSGYYNLLRKGKPGA